jgi:hypothetical protein
LKDYAVDAKNMPASSNNRYTDNGDGTVTDNKTGLIWLKNAICIGEMDWYSAQERIANLAHGECGLDDGSWPGTWRLATKTEWQEMLNMKYRWPALSNAAATGKWKEGDAFVGVRSSGYWSATTLAFANSYAWYVNLFHGNMQNASKNITRHVWPVRDGKK